MRICSGIGRGLQDRDLDGDDFSGMDEGGFRGALLGSELIEEVPVQLNWMEKMDEEPDEDLCRSFRSGESGIRKGNSVLGGTGSNRDPVEEELEISVITAYKFPI